MSICLWIIAYFSLRQYESVQLAIGRSSLLLIAFEDRRQCLYQDHWFLSVSNIALGVICGSWCISSFGISSAVATLGSMMCSRGSVPLSIINCMSLLAQYVGARTSWFSINRLSRMPHIALEIYMVPLDMVVALDSSLWLCRSWYPAFWSNLLFQGEFVSL